MFRPNCSPDEALRQAGDTASLYLSRALDIVDAQMGPNHRSPELLAALVAAQTSDFNACSHNAALYELADSIRLRIEPL